MNHKIEQNIVAEYFGRTIKIQFEYCPVCKYFKSCYEQDGTPHYINSECTYENVKAGIF